MEQPRNGERKQLDTTGTAQVALPAPVTRPRLTFDVDPRFIDCFFW